MESSESSSPQNTESSAKKKLKNHPRRFTDDQIKSLESIFKHETKLEPRNKMQIARDLGLQPRQVAIWFQNKRARWKSKQIEHEYRLLKSSYDSLSIKFDDLKREKQSLQMQLQEVNERLKNKDDANLINGDDVKIMTSCLELEEEMSERWCNLSATFENLNWWET